MTLMQCFFLTLQKWHLVCKRGVRLEEDLHHRALIKASETGQATGREMISCEAGEMCQRDNAAHWMTSVSSYSKQVTLKKLNYIMLYVKVIIWGSMQAGESRETRILKI